MENNPFQDVIHKLNNMEQEISNEYNKEDNNDHQPEPSELLFKAISNNVIQLLQYPPILESFTNISKQLGPEVTKSLVEMMATIMTQASYNALVFYDELLKNELTKQFDHITEYINNHTSTLKAHHNVIKIMRNQLDQWDKNRVISDIEKEINK